MSSRKAHRAIGVLLTSAYVVLSMWYFRLKQIFKASGYEMMLNSKSPLLQGEGQGGDITY